MTIASRHIHIILPLVAKSNFLLSGMEKMDVNSIQRDHLCTKFWGDLQQFITTRAMLISGVWKRKEVAV
ncbi:hypothetical protein CMV05_15410 [Vibrio anguillarum]|nr:hypothetical protein CMV05_15410 [Vibrio anguillarum]